MTATSYVVDILSRSYLSHLPLRGDLSNNTTMKYSYQIERSMRG